MMKNSSYFLPTNIPNIFVVTLLFIIGILWHTTSYSLLVPATISIVLTIVILAAPMFSNKNIKIFAIATLAFFAGNLRYRQQIKSQKNFFIQTSNKMFDIIAIVKNIQKTDGKINPFCTTFYIEKIRKSADKSSWKPFAKKIQIYTFKPLKLQVSDKVKAKNIKFNKPKNKDFIRYLIKQNIATTIFENNLSYKIIYRPKHSASRWLHQKKQKILESLKRKMPRKIFAIFSSIFLGNKNICKQESDKLKTKFKAWGILHLLARSGLHLIIFLLICEFILKFIPIYFLIKQIIMIILSILYLTLSWPSISFIRAFSVLILYKTCPMLNTKPDITNIVTVVCLTMLIYNPIQIFFLDFQLSFLLTFTLAIFSKIQIKQKRKCEM